MTTSLLLTLLLGTTAFTLEHARLLRTISAPAVSPDGLSVAHALDGREISVCAVDVGGCRSLGWEGGYVSELRWRPDGSAVSFLALDDRLVQQVWAWPLDGRAGRPLTSQYSDVTEHAWSPDGRRLAFLAEGPSRELRSPESSDAFTGEPVDVLFDGADLRSVLLLFSDVSGLTFILDPDVEGTVHARFYETPWDQAFEQLLASHGLGYRMYEATIRVGRLSTLTAELGRWRPRERPLVIDGLGFKSETAGYMAERERRLVVRDFDSGTESVFSDVPLVAEQLAWSPDGRSIALTGSGALDGRGALSMDLFVGDLTEKKMRRLVSSPLAEDFPMFSPSGAEVIYRREANPGDWPNTTHELAGVAVGGGRSRVLVGRLDREIEAPQVAADGRSVWFLLPDSGTVRLARARLEDGRVEVVVGGEQEISGFHVGGRGRVAFVSSTTSRPQALFGLTEAGAVRPLVDPNEGVMDGLRLPSAHRIAAKGKGGVRVEAFVLPPVSSGSAGTPPPAVVWLHGGPYSQHTASFDPFAQLLSQAGFAVILPNPRGSSGRGARFASAIRGAWETDDYRDVMALVDAAVAQKLADGQRLGVGGWSYGGWLTNHLLTRTQRFKAAVSGGSLSNMLAEYGVSDTAVWTEKELGLPWEAPARYVRISPLFEVDRVRTPTLVLCGKEDVRTPLGQSEQWYYALTRVGVQAELVIYPGEGHSFTRASNWDTWERSLAWYQRFLLPAPLGETSADVASSSRPQRD